MKLVIEEDKWLRGGGEVSGQLLNIHGKMCCLGFYALKAGYELDNIMNKGSPSELVETKSVKTNQDEYTRIDFIPDDRNELEKLLVQNGSNRLANSSTCELLMQTNDDDDITDDVRKQHITKYFKEIDVEVEFK